MICHYCEEPAEFRCLIYGCNRLVCDEHKQAHFAATHDGIVFEPLDPPGQVS